MSSHQYRYPTEMETAFLRVATRGYPELERQIESCQIADYDPTGWCYISVKSGPPSPIRYMAEGPELQTDDPSAPAEILLWTDSKGMLTTIEVVDYGLGLLVDPYKAFVDAAASNSLRYHSTPESQRYP